MTLLNWILLAMALTVVVPIAVVALETLAAVFARPPSKPVARVRPRVAVLIPAHNEEAVIAATLAALRLQLQPGDRALVVADNCTDRTSELARTRGAEVVERTHETLRGKGYALAAGVEHLRADPPEVLVMLDADTVPGKGCLAALVGATTEWRVPVQALYVMEQPSVPNARSRISALAFAFKNHVRALGADQLGWPCLLRGAGMAFPWEAIARAELATGNLVEDMQLGMDLALAGIAPRFCPRARVTGRLPDRTQAAKVQRTRWEHGHMQTIFRNVPRLLGRGVTQIWPGLIGLALDLAVPLLALLVMMWMGATALAGGMWALGLAGNTPLYLLTVAGVILGASILAGWMKFARHILPPGALLSIPLYILWKVPLYLAFLWKRQQTWIRTERSAMPLGVEVGEAEPEMPESTAYEMGLEVEAGATVDDVAVLAIERAEHWMSRVPLLRRLAASRTPAASPAVRPIFAVDEERRQRSKSAAVWVGWVLVLTLAHAPLLAYAALQLWAREAYQFFPFAWGVALILAAMRLPRTEPGKPAPLAGTLLLVIGVLLLLLSMASWTWALGMVALPINVAAVMLALGGWRLLKAALPAMAVYLTTVAPPFGLDSTVLTTLRQTAVVWSGKMLDTLGILHVVNGNLIEIPGHQLFVSEACSGIHSTVSSMAFAVVAAMFLRRGPVHATLLALLGILFAIAGNIVRIAGGTALLQWWDFDIISGWKHETAGMLIFGFCVAAILSADQLLAFFLRPVEERSLPRRTVAFVWPRMSWAIRGLAGVSLAAAVAAAIVIAPKVTWSSPMWGRQSIPLTAKFALPQTVGTWTQTALPPGLTVQTEAVKTDLWAFGNGRLHVVLAIDYPYPQLHDLPLCYQVQGWNISGRRFVTDGVGPSEELDLSRSTTSASVFFASIDERERWLVANEDQSFKEHLIRRFTDLNRPELDPRPSYQVQLVINRSEPLSAADRQEIEAFFRESRSNLARQLSAMLAQRGK